MNYVKKHWKASLIAVYNIQKAKFLHKKCLLEI